MFIYLQGWPGLYKGLSELYFPHNAMLTQTNMCMCSANTRQFVGNQFIHLNFSRCSITKAWGVQSAHSWNLGWSLVSIPKVVDKLILKCAGHTCI